MGWKKTSKSICPLTSKRGQYMNLSPHILLSPLDILTSNPSSLTSLIQPLTS